LSESEKEKKIIWRNTGEIKDGVDTQMSALLEYTSGSHLAVISTSFYATYPNEAVVVCIPSCFSLSIFIVFL
jgi:hypothetical protein